MNIMTEKKICNNIACYFPFYFLFSSFIQYEGRRWDKEKDRYFLARYKFHSNKST